MIIWSHFPRPNAALSPPTAFVLLPAIYIPIGPATEWYAQCFMQLLFKLVERRMKKKEIRIDIVFHSYIINCLYVHLFSPKWMWIWDHLLLTWTTSFGVASKMVLLATILEALGASKLQILSVLTFLRMSSFHFHFWKTALLGFHLLLPVFPLNTLNVIPLSSACHCFRWEVSC